MTHDEKLGALLGAYATVESRLALTRSIPPDIREEYMSSQFRGFDQYLIAKGADHDLINRLWNAYMIKQLTS